MYVIQLLMWMPLCLKCFHLHALPRKVVKSLSMKSSQKTRLIIAHELLFMCPPIFFFVVVVFFFFLTGV